LILAPASPRQSQEENPETHLEKSRKNQKITTRHKTKIKTKALNTVEQVATCHRSQMALQKEQEKEIIEHDGGATLSA